MYNRRACSARHVSAFAGAEHPTIERTAKNAGRDMQEINAKKVDRRVQKTKSTLTRVFRELLEEKSFEDITVNELCDRAQIRRATFYKHFNDKYDFLTAVIHNLRLEYDNRFWASSKPQSTSEYFSNYVKCIVHFVNDYDKTFEKLMKSDISNYLISVFMEENHRYTTESLTRAVENGMRLPVSPDVMASMLTGGVGQIILRWLKSGKQKPIDELFSEISAIIAHLEA